MAYDGSNTRQLVRTSEQLKAHTKSSSSHPFPAYRATYALTQEGADWVMRNTTHNRVTWRGSEDCELWEYFGAAARKALAQRRLKDQKAVVAAKRNDKDQDCLKLMAKRLFMAL